MKYKKVAILTASAFTCGVGMVWQRVSSYLQNSSSEKRTIETKCCTNYLLYSDQENGLTDEIWDIGVSKNTSVHWNLLQLTKSKDRTVRHKAVKSIVNLPVLNTWQQNVIAQASDLHTAIGIARSPYSKESLFLSSPFKDLKNEKLTEELLDVLFSLPLVESDVCLTIGLKRLKALSKKFVENNALDLEEPFHGHLELPKNKEIIHFEKLCLEALLSHSSIEASRKEMLSKHMFKLLYSAWKNHDDDVEFQSIIAQIISNLSIEDSFTKNLHLTGWVGILAAWSNSPHIEINLPASKALANLDTDDFHHCIYDSDIYLLHPLVRQSKTKLDIDIVFIHGLLGATFWTWRQHDSRKNTPLKKSSLDSELNSNYTFCWPKDWLAQDFPNARILSIDYNTCVTNWRAQCPSQERDNLEGRAKSIIDKLLLSKVGEKPIVWITHSMGGLVVKQILIEAMNSNRENVSSIAKKTQGIIFMSVPHKGSHLASIFHSAPYIFQPSMDISQIQIGSPKLKSLHEQFTEYVKQNSIKVLSFGETKKSRWGLTFSLLVSEDSADPGFGTFYKLPVDHLSTCKPQSRSDILYVKILEFLSKHLPVSNVSRTMYSQDDFERNLFFLI